MFTHQSGHWARPEAQTFDRGDGGGHRPDKLLEGYTDGLVRTQLRLSGLCKSSWPAVPQGFYSWMWQRWTSSSSPVYERTVLQSLSRCSSIAKEDSKAVTLQEPTKETSTSRLPRIQNRKFLEKEDSDRKRQRTLVP